MLILYPTILLVAVIWLYAEFDPWFKELILLIIKGVALELRKIPFLIRLEWDVFWMKRGFGMGKYIKMAEKLQKEIKDETD